MPADPRSFVEESLARERRARQAAAKSIRALLHPRSIAVVGASRKPGSIGAVLVENLRAAAFQGPVYPVNPNATEIQGLPCHPSVSAIGKPVDLAVIAVPAVAVEEAANDCARSGVRGLVVISAGFAETGPEGVARQARLMEIARTHGMRLVGPNCLGILNTDPAVGLNATFAPIRPGPGNIAMLSQSGALGLAILDEVRNLNLGMSSFVSVGNRADVSVNDLLAYWADDPRTRTVLLYLESFGNPRRFARLAPAVSRIKPIVAVKSGRSAAGSRAASSHSASLASLDIAVDALFEQAGVIRTNTLEELFDVTALLSTQPVPKGTRVGVVTNAGGPGILLADACEARGLSLPGLGAGTVEALRSFLPAQAGLGNPVDMIASAGPDQFERAISCVGADPAVDAVIVIYIPVAAAEPEAVASAIARGAGRVDPDKPILTVYLSTRGAPPALSNGPRGPLPSYSYPENAAMALSAAARYGQWRAAPVGRPFSLPAPAAAAVRSIADRALKGKSEPFWLEPRDLAEILRVSGISFAASEEADPEGVRAAAERLDFPLVAKAVAPGLLHKTEIGGVILGIGSADEAAAAAADLGKRCAAHGYSLSKVLLQRQVDGGIEALVGVTSDPTFGPLLVCGLGGILVELLRDVSHHLLPLRDTDAEEMISRLKTVKLLDGYRGMPAGDRAALADVLLRVASLVEIVPEIRELDLNPVKIMPPGQGAIVVDGRMRLGASK